MNKVSDFREFCESSGLKATPQRMIVFQELLTISRHPSVDEVYRSVKKKLPNISYDTVHRTLNTFVEMGILEALEGWGDARRYDTDLEEHHHFRCSICKEIRDIPSEELRHLSLSRQLKEKYAISKTSVCLTGTCPRCQNADMTNTSK